MNTQKAAETKAQKGERLAKELGLLFFRGNKMEPMRSGALKVTQVFWLANADDTVRYGPISTRPHACAEWLVRNETMMRAAIASGPPATLATEG